MTLEITNHPISKRIKVIKIKETELDKLIFPFNKHSIQSLEYKPFSRFSLAKSVDDVFSISEFLDRLKILIDAYKIQYQYLIDVLNGT